MHLRVFADAVEHRSSAAPRWSAPLLERSHLSWTPARVIVKTSGVQTGRPRVRVNRRLKAVRRLSDDLSGPSTRVTWATRPSRGPGTLWALQAQQSRRAAPTVYCERLPSSSWACNCLPLSVRLDVVERPEVQPLASGLSHHPVEFTLGFVGTTGFELRCEDIVAAVIAESPHGTGQTIGFLPHQLNHRTPRWYARCTSSGSNVVLPRVAMPGRGTDGSPLGKPASRPGAAGTGPRHGRRGRWSTALIGATLLEGEP